MKRQKEENEIITNITKYLLDFMFDIELEENNENAQDNNFENSEEYLNYFEDNELNIKLEGKEIDKDDNEYLNFDVFYDISKNKKKEKNL